MSNIIPSRLTPTNPMALAGVAAPDRGLAVLTTEVGDTGMCWT